MTEETEKEIRQRKKRFMELADKSYIHNRYTYTGFLDLGEQEVLYRLEREEQLPAHSLFGGREGCERRMLRFGSAESLGYEEEFPIVCLAVKPLMEKFADELSHRDFLGALMNLGIDRSTLGDIVVQGKTAFLFCTETIAPFIEENLTKVRHTQVGCSPVRPGEWKSEEPVREQYVVSSERADAVIAKVYNLSREKSLELFRMKRVYINGRLTENNSCFLKGDDVVNARGYGKFVYRGNERETRKGKLSVAVDVYR